MPEHQDKPRAWPPKAPPPAGLPDVEELIAFRDGTLDAAAEARVRALLEASPAAMAELLDLEEFAEPAATAADADGERMAPVAIEAAWQRFEAALDAPAAPPVVPLRRRPAARAGWLALAAALIAALGLSLLGPRGSEDPGGIDEHVSPPGAQALFVEGFESGGVELVIEGSAPRDGAPEELLLETGFEDGEIRGWTVVDSSSSSRG